MAELLGFPVVEINAKTKDGFEELLSSSFSSFFAFSTDDFKSFTNSSAEENSFL